MRFTQDYENLRDAEVVDVNGDRVGGVGQVYLNDATGEPEWVTVKTGLFGLKETMVPLADATIQDQTIRVPYEKAFIKDAPNVEGEAHLDDVQRDDLYRYYGDGRTDRTDAAYGDEPMVGAGADRDFDRRDDGLRDDGVVVGDPGRRDDLGGGTGRDLVDDDPSYNPGPDDSLGGGTGRDLVDDDTATARQVSPGPEPTVEGGYEPRHHDGVREDGLREDGLRDDAIRDDGLREDGLRDDAIRDDGLREDGLRDDPIRDDGLREDGLREDGLLDDPDRRHH